MYDMGFGSSSSHAGSRPGGGGFPGGMPGGGFGGGRPMSQKEAEELFSKMFGGMNIDQVMQDLLRQMQNQKGGNPGNFRVQMNMKDMEDLFKKGGPFGGQGFPGGFPDPFGGAFNQRAQQSSNTKSSKQRSSGGRTVVSRSTQMTSFVRDGQRIQSTVETITYSDGTTESHSKEQVLGSDNSHSQNVFGNNPFLGGGDRGNRFQESRTPFEEQRRDRVGADSSPGTSPSTSL